MPVDENELLSIGTVSRRSGIAASALRYYESMGLIKSVRAPSGRRYYPRATLRRISFIAFAQKVGFSLDEIAEQLAELGAVSGPTRDEWKNVWGIWSERVDERIAKLNALREGLDKCIGCGCLSLANCSIYNPADRMAINGPGPRKWMGDPMKPTHPPENNETD